VRFFKVFRFFFIDNSPDQVKPLRKKGFQPSNPYHTMEFPVYLNVNKKRVQGTLEFTKDNVKFIEQDVENSSHNFIHDSYNVYAAQPSLCGRSSSLSSMSVPRSGFSSQPGSPRQSCFPPEAETIINFCMDSKELSSNQLFKLSKFLIPRPNIDQTYNFMIFILHFTPYSEKKAVHKVYSFTPMSEPASHIVHSIRHHLSNRKKILTIVNPVGGDRKGISKFNKYVYPMFTLAGCDVTLETTKYRLHAKNILHDLPLDIYDIICTLSGDGLFHEAINGLLSRKDQKDAIQKCTVGIIPGGTGNGLAKSLDTSKIEIAVLNMIRGKSSNMDLFAFSQEGEKPLYGFLEVLWALIADIDLESEKIRFMGPSRLTIWGALRGIFLRSYRAKVF
jgi:hypothetical protein